MTRRNSEQHIMNTMELVRLVERAQPRRESSPQPALFPAKLAAPARQAIVRARQHLLSEQKPDGAWRGLQSGDVSLPSQLIFLLTYLERDDSPLIGQAAATIRDSQLPRGGWSSTPGDEADLDVSIQAYFALKLAGVDVSDPCLQRARRVIRRKGGVDAAGTTTRRFLALLGQIDYDCCPSINSRSIVRKLPHALGDVPHFLIQSVRASRDTGIARGVRELFIHKPSRWPATAAARRERSAAARFVSQARIFVQELSERFGFAALERRAADCAEHVLLGRTSAEAIRQLNFGDLVWHTIALHALGFSPDRAEMQRTMQQLDAMIRVLDDRDRAVPQHRPTPFADTVLALRSLRSSGSATNHPAMLAAVRRLSKISRTERGSEVLDLAGIVHLIRSASTTSASGEESLPPGIEICHDSQRRASTRTATKIFERAQPLIVACVDQLLATQTRSGCWRDSMTTARVLEALGADDNIETQNVVQRAVAYLRRTQHADGSWADSRGVASIHATAAAVCGLIAAGVANDNDTIAAALNWLAAEQLPSGGWGERFSADERTADTDIQQLRDRETSPSHTAHALGAFVAAGQAAHPAALRAVNLLVEIQDDSGGWEEAHFTNHDASADNWFANEHHAAAIPMLALSRWALAAASTQSEMPGENRLGLVSDAVDD
jgi:squalene-hopene/tetraprenyl-beta-curcumene cyclase